MEKVSYVRLPFLTERNSNTLIKRSVCQLSVKDICHDMGDWRKQLSIYGVFIYKKSTLTKACIKRISAKV